MGTMNAHQTDVLIVGGGPVGLFLACLLAQQNIDCIVLEKRTESSTHTRSIGIHPPALRSLATVGIADAVISGSVKIRKGHVFFGKKRVGQMSLDVCPPPYPFVLSIPQFRTEACLESRLAYLSPHCLRRGASLESLESDTTGVSATVLQNEKMYLFRAKFLVGCDGHRSTVRNQMDVMFRGSEYDDHYLMGDFEDYSGLGPDAAVFLGEDGVVESFPMPDGSRRWVARMQRQLYGATASDLARIVQERTLHRVESSSCSMFSSFQPHHFQVSQMSRGRILFAGDAAHVISPIGGQGMNLGWIDAAHASRVLSAGLENYNEWARLSHTYSAQRLSAAHRARRGAEFNMWMGRPGRFGSKIKSVATRLILSKPLTGYFARRFTMQDT
jgi:2-polyprenyl-6-methoxyphenol hydroxylase-like FAD-dependent oxidoreductase